MVDSEVRLRLLDGFVLEIDGREVTLAASGQRLAAFLARFAQRLPGIRVTEV